MATIGFGQFCLALFAIWIPVATGHFNLYLNLNEVKRILGLSKELYYVTEGVVNEYALNFVVPVPPDINALHFTWQSLGLKSLPYTSSIEISDSLAMRKPTMNISSKGYIPTAPQTFQILLPCTGAKSSEVYLELTLNVTIPPPVIDGKQLPATSTSVVIKRKIFCYEDPNFSSKQREMTLDHPTQPNNSNQQQQPKSKGMKSKTSSSKSTANGNGPDSNNNNNNGVINGNGEVEVDDDGDGESSSVNSKRRDVLVISTEEAVGDNSNMIYIIMGSSLGLIIILIALASGAIAYVRTRKVANTAESSGFLHIETSGNGSSGSGSGTGSGGSLFLRSDSPHHYTSVSPSHDLGPYSYSSFNSPNNNPNTFYSEISTCTKSKISDNSSTIDSNCKLAEMMTIARCKVRLQSVIMEGSFARVYNGTVLERLGSEKKVIVKTVVDHSSPVQMALLLHEGLSLVGMLQQHVLTVIGVAAEERVPPFLIYPDEGFRNLKRFLQRCRSGPGRPITAQEIVHMAIQIASGIAFLHRQNVVHRDIATRNCVLDDKLIVKVSDSALSKDLFPEDYHWMGEAESRPVKWMPPESILQNRTSMAADMWSFGVLLWEITTFAQQPYADIDINELNSFLTMGYRLPQPINCPDELYSSMTRCWTWDPDNRPKWTHVLPELQDLHAQLAQYV